MKIIAFTGKKQHGKSTAVRYLMEKFPGAARLNFKDALVAEIKEKFPELLDEMVRVYDRIEYDGMNQWSIVRLFEDKPPLMRALLRNYGTEVRRGDNPDYWVRQWESAIFPFTDMLFVDDVRFLNEVVAVHSKGGIIVRIVKRGESLDTDSHASESEMDGINVDHTIENDFEDIEVLYKQLDKIFHV